MSINNQHNKSAGMSLVGILLAMAIITTALVSLLAIVSVSLRAAVLRRRVYQANLLAQELMEGVRNFRDNTTWDTDGLGVLSLGSPYHLELVGAPQEWGLAVGQEVDGDFTKSITFYSVRRDASKDIVESGGAVDSETKSLEARVLWLEKGQNREVSLKAFFTNWQE